MKWALDQFEQELLWSLNIAEFMISEEVEWLIELRFKVTIRRAAVFAAMKVNRLSMNFLVGEGWLPLDDQILDQQIAQTIQELKEAGEDEHRIRLIARTSLMRTYNTTALKHYRGFGIQQYRYLAHATACTDPKELPDGTVVEGGCIELHNQIYPIDDEVHVPPIHPNCRCTIVPVLKEV